MNRYERFYKRLDELLGGVKDFCTGPRDYLRIENEPYMALSIDRLSSTRISMAHNFIQNGDVIPDPDMEIVLRHETRMAWPVALQNALGRYYRVEWRDEQGRDLVDLRQKKEQAQFLDVWLRNLKEQGFFDEKKRVEAEGKEER